MKPATIGVLLRIVLGGSAAFAFVNGCRPGAPVPWLWVALGAFLAGEALGAAVRCAASGDKGGLEVAGVFGPMAASMARLTMLLAFVTTAVTPWWVFIVFFYHDALAGLVRIFTVARDARAPQGPVPLAVSLQVAAIFCVLLMNLLQAHGVRIMPGLILGYHPGFWILLTPAVASVVSTVPLFTNRKSVVLEMMKPK